MNTHYRWNETEVGTAMTVIPGEEPVAVVPRPKRVSTRITMRDIETGVATRYGISVKTLHGPLRTRAIAYPRMVAMYLMREMTANSLPQIGRYFGKDHTTVLHAERKIAEFVKYSPEFAFVVQECRNIIRATPGEFDRATAQAELLVAPTEPVVGA